MNMFMRAKAAFGAKRSGAPAVLRQADFVAGDETGMRIEGVNGFHRVFHCKGAVVYAADFTRSAEVVRETMGRPERRPSQGTGYRASGKTPVPRDGL